MRAIARRLVTERFAWVDGHADVWAVFADAVLWPPWWRRWSNRSPPLTKSIGKV